MKKIILGILLLFIVMGIACAAHNNEIFTAPAGLHGIGYNDFVDEQGHNIMIIEYTDEHKQTWFENDTETSYLVEPYDGNNSFYIYVDGAESDPTTNEASGILEIVEHEGNKYIINSWTATDSNDDFKIACDNLLEFNKLNQLTPIPIEG